MISLLFILAGLILLVAGGDALVRGASGLAARLGVSPLFAGLVIVGFGTSAPELTTSVSAALAGSPGIAVGNVVGSNIANILLILGAAVIVSPLAVRAGAFKRDAPALLIATALAAGALAFLPMGRWAGAALCAALIVYVAVSFVMDRTTGDAAAALHAAEADSVAAPDRIGVAAGLTLAGLAGVVLGAMALVRGAVALAGALGAPEALIGLTVVAVGTSLPELAASLAAARRGQGDIALGNVIGSNIFNASFILGAAAIAAPFDPPASIIGLDVWVMGAAAVLLTVFALTGWRIDRREGAALLLAYAGYIAWTAL
mgnify:CR=1 FL=1